MRIGETIVKEVNDPPMSSSPVDELGDAVSVVIEHQEIDIPH